MTDRPDNARQADKAARTSKPSAVQKPDRAQTDARDDDPAPEPTASRPRGHTEDPDKTL